MLWTLAEMCLVVILDGEESEKYRGLSLLVSGVAWLVLLVLVRVRCNLRLRLDIPAAG